MRTAQTLSPQVVLRNYFHAKDENRPHLLDHVFTPNADLVVRNSTTAVSFPTETSGRGPIADVLVRNFGLTYENVYSFYMAKPDGFLPSFTCDWAVAMSEKSSGAVRVGCGRYFWEFGEPTSGLATHLKIDILVMQVSPPSALEEVLSRVQRLSYPWSSAAEAEAAFHGIEAFESVLRHLAY